MRKIYLLLMTVLITSSLFAQKGIKFDPEFTVDWTTQEAIQIPASSSTPVKSQVVFIGGKDSVVAMVNGKPMNILSKENNDFIGITPTGTAGEYLITVNHERTDNVAVGGNGGGMSMFKIKTNNDNSVEVVEQTLADGRKGKFFHVDFENTTGETWNNCGGIIGPNGEIWTAEEYPPANNNSIVSSIADIRNVKVGHGPIHKVTPPVTPAFNGQTIKRNENVGWMVHIDPATGRATQKMYTWGRMSFEGGVMMPDGKTFFFFEDGRPGILTKFVADNANDLTKGKLYAYKEGLNDPTNGNWVMMDNSNLTEMINLHDEALKKGATMFIRLEWGTEINGKVYICETGYDRPTKQSSWQNALTLGGVVAQHHKDRASVQGTSVSDDNNPYYDYYGRILVYDPATDVVSTHIEGGGLNNHNQETSQNIANYPSIHLSNPDGLGKATIKGVDYLVINEDLNGSSFNRLPDDYSGWACEMYLLDASITNPTLNDLIRIGVGPTGSELTGGNGTQDGKSILVNAQHPGADKYPFRSHESTTLSLTGFDKLASINDAKINIDWTADQGFQYNSNLHYQVLFVGGTDKVQALDWNGEPYGEVVSRENNDFIGITPAGTGEYYITVNHERTDKYIVTGNGGGMTMFKIKRVNDGTDTFEIVDQTLADGRSGKLFAVDFINTVGETWNNCGGIIGPNGEIWTAEEYPPSSLLLVIGMI
jgi:secreted PhoX family phosphatase